MDNREAAATVVATAVATTSRVLSATTEGIGQMAQRKATETAAHMTR